MFFFGSKKYNFWDIYNCIHKFYPIGITGEVDALYNSYPGIIERGKIIAENIYDDNVYKQRWVEFYEEIAHLANKKVIATNIGITSCFSARMELFSMVADDLTRTKEILFFVSLLGPFYTVMGIDRNEITIENKFYQSTNFLIASPEGEYKDHFTFICNQIEKQFENYRYVPLFMSKQIIDGLVLDYKDSNCSVFDAIFNGSLNFNVNTIGVETYKISQWATGENEAPGYQIFGLR